MSTPGEQPINDFLDRMNPTEREAFLSSRPVEATTELRLHLAIDSSLHRLFGDRPLQELDSRIASTLDAEVRARPATFRSRARRGLAAAALLALSAAGLWYSWNRTRPAAVVDVYAPQPWRDFAAVYHDMLREGFRPAWVCRTEKQFETAFMRQLRQPLLLAALPSHVTAGGISYSHTLSEKTMTVLGRVEGEPVLVFVDRVEVDRLPPPPPPPGLNLFRRVVDDLVLYELTPLDHPGVLPLLYNPARATGP
jgi:hypothetical protein